VKRGETEILLCVDSSALRDQELDHRRVSAGGRAMQRRFTRRINVVHIRSGSDENPCALDVSSPRSSMQLGLSTALSRNARNER
jgi:hypothetical protein